MLVLDPFSFSLTLDSTKDIGKSESRCLRGEEREDTLELTSRQVSQVKAENNIVFKR